MLLDVDSLRSIERGHRLVQLIEVREVEIITSIKGPNGMLDVAIKPLVVRVKKGDIVRVGANMI